MAQLTHRDLVLIRSNAIEEFVRFPTRCRLPGMIADLNDDDKRSLAYLKAAMSTLSRLGALTGPVDVVPEPYTAVQEVIDDGVVRHNFTPQK